MTTPRGVRILVVSATAAVAAAVAAGLVLLGSPGDERTRRMDERRAEDLRSISSAADVYWRQNRRAAASLELLEALLAENMSAADPRTGRRYEYRVIDSTRYELCAEFERAGAPRYVGDQFAAHGIGRTCFPLEIRRTRP